LPAFKDDEISKTVSFEGILIKIENEPLNKLNNNTLIDNWTITVESDPDWFIRVKYSNDIDLHVVGVSSEEGAIKNVTQSMTHIKHFLTPNGKVIDYKTNSRSTTEDGYQYQIDRLSFNERVLNIRKLAN